MSDTLLLTGFEPYGGRDLNPSAEVVAALDRAALGVGNTRIVGRTLPVCLHGLRETVGALLDEIAPRAVVCLGLAPGTPVIRLERIAVNLADFDSPDNAGMTCRNRPLDPHGPDARLATLPLDALLDALLDAGVPAQLSDSAGLYLCNAVSYEFLRALAGRAATTPCGFVHLPYLPQQVAADIAAGRLGRGREDGYAGTASMALGEQIRAVELILKTTLQPPGEHRQ